MIRLQWEVPGGVYIPLCVSFQANHFFYNHGDHRPLKGTVHSKKHL